MDIEKYVKLNENGEIEFDKEGFKSEYDSAISKAIDKFANGKGKEQMRKLLEEEAKLSAEEKLKQERETFEKYRLEETIKLNQAKARAKLDDKLFSKEEIDFILASVNTDEEKSLAAIDTLVNARKKFIDDTQKSAIENLQKQQQQTAPASQFKAADPADPQPPTRRTSEEILSYYKPKK